MENYYVQFLIFLILTIVIVTCDASYYMKKDHSLIKPYADDHWEFVGHTMVTNNYVRLTADVRSSQGAIWNTAPCQLRDWELHVHFRIHGSAAELYGDGLAVWYTKHRMELGRVFGSRDFFSGLGVFIDTYANQNGQHNHGHPYISAMVSNGSVHYDHDMDGTHTALSGCQANVRGQREETFLAVRYENNQLMVSTDLDGTNSWKLCFKVSGVHLPTGYYFGVSAVTGDLSDNHDIISLKLYDIGVDRQDDDSVDYSLIEPSADAAAAPRERVDDVKSSSGGGGGGGGWKVAVFVVIGIITLCAVIGCVLYVRSQQTSRKRLY